VATGALRPPEELVRFALDPNGRLTPDLGSKLPGRGAYASSSREAVVAAASRGLFEHTLKKPAPLPEGLTPEGLASTIERGLEKRLLSAMGLARRVGALVSGFEKTSEALRCGKAALAVVAADAGADGRKKISRLAQDAPVLSVFDAASLSGAIGSEGATYCAVLKGDACDRILREARRLSGFKPCFLVLENEEKTGELQAHLRA
jgi:predicted RNA-binding protein YlxR (DUF448 family)/ribosomal protein L30E